jgi:acyl-CoA synthetase (AMP-forming)/AMP-acid ligase II
MPISWAVHRLNGISCPASAVFSASELALQLQNSGAKCLFTCIPLLPIALEAAAKVGISKERIYLCPIPKDHLSDTRVPYGMKTLEDLIASGDALPRLKDQRWTDGQGKRQTAFLCYSSGTSGLPVSLIKSAG